MILISIVKLENANYRIFEINTEIASYVHRLVFVVHLT
jgi:hypothetical protein